MLKRIILKSGVLLIVAMSAVMMPACQTSDKARPEMLTGDTAHERHAEGVDSHTAD